MEMFKRRDLQKGFNMCRIFLFLRMLQDLENHKNNEKSSDYYKTEINHNNNVYIKYTTTLNL